jgi:phage protein U
MMRGPVMATAPTPSQLLTLGMFVFGMDTLAYSDLQRRITWRHEASDRFGARPAVQFIGPGDDDVTIAGACIPEIAGRYSALDTLASMGDTGDAWALMNGLGEVWGYYVIVGLDLTHQTVMAGGVPAGSISPSPSSARPDPWRPTRRACASPSTMAPIWPTGSIRACSNSRWSKSAGARPTSFR